MAAGGKSFVKRQRIQGFTALLTSAACEGVLIFLMLVDAMLSYLLTKFASYCQLQAPCLLCSRLDCVLGGKNPEFYQYLCSNHRSEISSLISCHIHGKVAEGHGMCDDCLLSVTAKTVPNTKTQRLLVGKLGLILGGCGFQSPSLSRDLFTGSMGSRPCTCCGKLWKSVQNTPRSIQLKSPGRAVLKPHIPLPNVPRQSRLSHRDNLKKIRDKFSGSVTAHCLGKSSFDPLSHVGYTEVKLTSDSESEFPQSDDDYEGSVFHENIEASDDPIAQSTSVILKKCLVSDSNPAKPKSSSPNPLPLLLDPCAEPDTSKGHDVKFLGSGAVNDYGLGEINWQQLNQKSSSSDPPELISLNEVSPSPNVVNNSKGESEESKITCLSQNSLPSPPAEVMTSDSAHTFVEASPEKSVEVTRASGISLIPKKLEEDLEKISIKERASTETDLIINDSAPTSPKQENLSNTSKFPVTTKEREVPGFVIQQPTIAEVDRVKEDLKLLPSHNSSHRGCNMSSVVPINHVHYPEIEAEASRANGIQVLQKSASVESGLESLDGSIISGIEGESTVDQLKRQIEYDKKCMNALHKELEEERNASAIAANEAMAMITRLQEEKAALHMEALQYLRMMEEQSEYDGDALEKANDLLTEKEKELQDLEAELECYRLNLMEEPMVQSMHKESCNLKGDTITLQNVDLPHITNTAKISSNTKITVSKVSDEAVAGEISSLEFEEEKLYISQCLKSLGKKLHQIYYSGISSNMPNGRPEKLEDSKTNQQGYSYGERPQLDGQRGETDLSIHNNIDTNGSLTDLDASVASDSDGCSPSEENNHSTSVGPKSSMPRKKVDLVALISDLNDRLEALEADHDLLERILNSHRNGNDGLQFIQDIAHQLHELRKIGIR